jgi:hypothetical protein
MEFSATVLPASQEREVSMSDRNASFEPVLTDAALDEIKKQSTAGCLLCAINEWAEDDWE